MYVEQTGYYFEHWNNNYFDVSLEVHVGLPKRATLYLNI